MSRRKALASGAAAAGFLSGAGSVKKAQARPPGPDESYRKRIQPGKTPIRICADLRRPENGTITGRIKEIRETGHTGTYMYHSYWKGITKTEIAEIREALDRYGIVMFEFGGYVNMLHPDAATRERFLKLLVECIETAESLGCPMVGTISGSCDEHPYGINVHPDNWTLAAWKLLVKGIRQVLKDTAGSGVALGMEAQVTTNLDSPRAHKRLMEDVGDKRCVVNLDPTNMVTLESYYHTGELIDECFELLGESIYGCHAKDTYIWPDKQTVHIQEVCPGRGVLDYETYLARMSKMAWPRTLRPEHIPDDQYAEAETYIRTVAKKIGVAILE